MKPKFNAITVQQVKQAGVQPMPKFSREVVRLAANLRLRALIGKGLYLQPSFGEEAVRVKFSLISVPYRAHGGEACPHGWGNGCTCGYWAVKVRSSYGTRSCLYYEPERDRVSGTLNVWSPGVSLSPPPTGVLPLPVIT